MRGVPILVALAVAGTAFPQAMVEYGMAVGRAGVTGASIGAGGKATGQVANKAAKAMEKVPSKKGRAPTQTQPAAELAPPVKVPPPSSHTPVIDPSAIPVGLEREELFRQFGKPSTRITQQQGTDVVEKCWYKSAGYDSVVVTLRNGKVASVGT